MILPRRTHNFGIQRGFNNVYADSNGSWGVKASTQSSHWTEYHVTGSSFHIYSLPYAAPSENQLSGSSMGDIFGARAPKRGPESHLHMDLVMMAMYMGMKRGWPLTKWGACRFILASFTIVRRASRLCMHFWSHMFEWSRVLGWISYLNCKHI